MCSTKITRDNFIATFGTEVIEIDENSAIVYAKGSASLVCDYRISGKECKTLGEVHALYKSLMHEDFKLK